MVATIVGIPTPLPEKRAQIISNIPQSLLSKRQISSFLYAPTNFAVPRTSTTLPFTGHHSAALNLSILTCNLPCSLTNTSKPDSKDCNTYQESPVRLRLSGEEVAISPQSVGQESAGTQIASTAHTSSLHIMQEDTLDIS